MDCIFCAIVSKQIPSHLLWEDENHMAFLSIFPNIEAFSVVIPKKHYGSYVFEHEENVIAALMMAAKKTATLIDSAYEEVGRCGVIFEGWGVDHLHVKLFPMHGTGNMTQWKPIESNQKKFFTQYEGYISSHDFDRADDQWLKRVAEKIKKQIK